MQRAVFFVAVILAWTGQSGLAAAQMMPSVSPDGSPIFPLALESSAHSVELLRYSKKSAEKMASLLNDFAAVASVIGTLCPSTCGRSISALAATARIASLGADQAASTADGDDYIHIATPEVPEINVADFPQSAQDLISELARAIGLVKAAYITSNRAAAAAEHGSLDWSQRQQVALGSYEAELQPVLRDLQSNLAAYSGATNVSFDTIRNAYWHSWDRVNRLFGRVNDDIKSWSKAAAGASQPLAPRE